jgi:hypothetical protein
MRMTKDEMILSMPAYAAGQLSANDAFQVSRALTGSPELREELRFALMLRNMLRAGEAAAPPLPELKAAAPRVPAVVSPRGALERSAEKAERAFAITGSAVRLALGFL